ncbi:MAG: division/outer membrane stress-associated lipid-binding lipoprotein [Thalassotalea sp.]
MKKSKLLLPLLSVVLLQGCVAAALVGVVGGATVAADKRSVGQQIDDQTIEFNTYHELNKLDAIKEHTNLQVTSMNGTLLIVGQAPNSYLKELASKTVSEVKGVKQIHNQIRISNSTSVLTTSNDVWLTSKVKTALFGSDNLEATNIKVVTENGEVFLMGLVSNKEAEEAVEIARNISGVNKVYKAFEYID